MNTRVARNHLQGRATLDFDQADDKSIYKYLSRADNTMYTYLCTVVLPVGVGEGCSKLDPEIQ